MRSLMLLVVLGALTMPVRAQECTLDLAGETHALEHIYALRIPEPFNEHARMTRLICTETVLPEAALAEEIALVQAFHADGQRGMFVDLRDDGTALSVRLSWGDASTMSSGSVTEITFEGKIGSDQLRGTITTEPPLSVYGKEIPWRVSAEVDLSPVTVW